jgi:hypothetical protein
MILPTTSRIFGGEPIMRHLRILTALLVTLAAPQSTNFAQDCGCTAAVPACDYEDGCGCGEGGGCGGCGLFGGKWLGHGCCLCGLFAHKHKGPGYEGLDPSFNCGCNGSYKYPVPPLYTYHWPGMWQQNVMTDYHSPWRFPPLKPYVDEPVAEIEMGLESEAPGQFRSVSHLRAAGEPASFSSRLEAMTR